MGFLAIDAYRDSSPKPPPEAVGCIRSLPLTRASPHRVCLLLQQKMDFGPHLTLLLDATTSEGKFLPFTSLAPPSSSDPSSKQGTNLGIEWL
ncbi:hypothetical protein KSP40_PGU019635 [Platanthera guangdongensis]|uniref:Uncharacterized protein n=1 Tax=Platanthera guangdongensis TaxID=2320717 RepID=A0ABR2LXK6_9ASPA